MYGGIGPILQTIYAFCDLQIVNELILEIFQTKTTHLDGNLHCIDKKNQPLSSLECKNQYSWDLKLCHRLVSNNKFISTFVNIVWNQPDSHTLNYFLL